MTFGFATQAIFHAFSLPLLANWKKEEDSEDPQMVKSLNGRGLDFWMWAWFRFHTQTALNDGMTKI